MIVARASTDVTTLTRMEEIHRRQMPRLLGCLGELTPCSRSQLAQAELLYRLGVATRNPDRLREAITRAEKLMPNHHQHHPSVTAVEVATVINDASKALAKVGGPRIRQAEIDNRLVEAKRWDEQNGDRENELDLERTVTSCIIAGQSKERSSCINNYTTLARKQAETSLSDYLVRQDTKIFDLFLTLAWAELDAGIKLQEPAYLEAGRVRLTLLKDALPKFNLPASSSDNGQKQIGITGVEQMLDTWIFMIEAKERELRMKPPGKVTK